MSKKIYIPDSGGIARQAKKIYIPVNGVAHKVKKIYIGDSENKARQCFSSEYVWKKYVSKRSYTQTKYEKWTASTSYSTFYIFPNVSSEFAVEDSDGGGWQFDVGSGFNYNENYGTFSLTGIRHVHTSTTVSLSKHDIETILSNKWIIPLSGNTTMYRIGAQIGENLNWVDLNTVYHRGDSYTLYHYTYEYKGDVVSENENAYTSGSIGDYTSRSSTDVRTVYIRKE